jgi:hypothetical protein
LKVGAGGVHDQLWQKRAVERNRRIGKLEFRNHEGIESRCEGSS